MTDNPNAEALPERGCDCRNCRKDVYRKIGRHVCHSLGREVDKTAVDAIVRTLSDAGFHIRWFGSKAEREYDRREAQIVERLRRERQQRSHEHVKALLRKIAAEMPDGGIRVFIDDVELADNHVCIQVKDGELIDSDDKWTDWFGPPSPQESDVPF